MEDGSNVCSLQSTISNVPKYAIGTAAASDIGKREDRPLVASASPGFLGINDGATTTHPWPSDKYTRSNFAAIRWMRRRMLASDASTSPQKADLSLPAGFSDCNRIQHQAAVLGWPGVLSLLQGLGEGTLSMAICDRMAQPG